MKSVTVFVKRVGGHFHASTMAADAVDVGSASIAARRCAARHFGVSEAEIEMLPDGEHVMIARLLDAPRAVPHARVPAGPRWSMLAAALVVLAVTAAVFFAATGGAL